MRLCPPEPVLALVKCHVQCERNSNWRWARPSQASRSAAEIVVDTVSGTLPRIAATVSQQPRTVVVLLLRVLLDIVKVLIADTLRLLWSEDHECGPSLLPVIDTARRDVGRRRVVLNPLAYVAEQMKLWLSGGAAEGLVSPVALQHQCRQLTTFTPQQVLHLTHMLVSSGSLDLWHRVHWQPASFGAEGVHSQEFRIALDMAADRAREYGSLRSVTIAQSIAVVLEPFGGHLSCFEAVFVTLHYLAKGSNLRGALESFSGVSASTLSRVTRAVLGAVSTTLWAREVIMPEVGSAEWCESERVMFMRSGGQLPGVVGAIDDTHFPIAISEAAGRREFINKDGKPTISGQFIVGGQGLFFYASVGHNGRQSDRGKLNRGDLLRSMIGPVQGRMWMSPYFLAGDSGFHPGHWWLLLPFCGRDHGVDVSGADHQVNVWHDALLHCRVVVEQAFGIMKARWRLLQVGWNGNLKRDQVKLRLLAAVALHNYALRTSPPVPNVKHALHATCPGSQLGQLLQDAREFLSVCRLHHQVTPPGDPDWVSVAETSEFELETPPSVAADFPADSYILHRDAGRVARKAALRTVFWCRQRLQALHLAHGPGEEAAPAEMVMFEALQEDGDGGGWVHAGEAE